MSIRILITDDHKLFRRGLVALLGAVPDFDIVGEAADGAEGLKQAIALKPDVMLLDLHMPGISGIDALASLREMAPDTRVLMLTVSEDGADLLAALRAGAAGYLLKNIDGEFLAESIRRAAQGGPVVSGDMMGKLVDGVREPEPAGGLALLSPRERDILAHIARGASNKEIARDLGVAESTVKIHVQHILRKLHLSSRVQAAVFATESGMAAKAPARP